jgi:hypothetical protein
LSGTLAKPFSNKSAKVAAAQSLCMGDILELQRAAPTKKNLAQTVITQKAFLSWHPGKQSAASLQRCAQACEEMKWGNINTAACGYCT